MKYWAFISYSSYDDRIAKRLHRQLENFPIPRDFTDLELAPGEPLGKRLRPIFRDRDELSSSSQLGPAIEHALEQSRYLIVICSPNSAKSEWVDKEIETFRKQGKGDQILAVIAGGIPNASFDEKGQECFPPSLRLPFEPLAADIREGRDGKARGPIKLIAGILETDFEVLWRRHLRRQRQLILGYSILTLFVIAGMIAMGVFSAKHKRIAIEKTEVAAKETVRADVQEALAGENQKTARLNLARSDLELADRFRRNGNLQASFAYLARSLKNDPSSVEASELAWAMLTGTRNYAFSRNLGELPLWRQRLATCLFGSGKGVAWIDTKGVLIVKEFLDGRGRGEVSVDLELGNVLVNGPLVERFYAEGTTLEIRINDGSGYGGVTVEIFVDLEALEISSRRSLSSTEEYEKKENLHQELLSDSVRNKLKRLQQDASGVVNFSDVDEESRRELLEYYQSVNDPNDLFVDFPPTHRRSSSNLLILPDGSVCLISGLPVSKFEVIAEHDLIMIRREVPKRDESVFEFVVVKDGKAVSKNAFSSELMESCGAMLSASRNHLLLWNGNQGAVVGLENLATIMTDASSLETDLWDEILDVSESVTLGQGTPSAFNFDEKNRLALICKDNKITSYFLSSDLVETRRELDFSEATLYAPYHAIDLSEPYPNRPPFSNTMRPLEEDVVEQIPQISDSGKWLFFDDDTLAVQNDSGAYEIVATFSSQSKEKVWFSPSQEWIATIDLTVGKWPRLKQGSEGGGITLYDLNAPEEFKRIPFPKSSEQKFLKTFEKKGAIYIALSVADVGGMPDWAIQIPKKSWNDAEVVPIDKIEEVFSDFPTPYESTLVKRKGFVDFGRRLEQLDALGTEQPMIRPIERGKKSVVFSQILDAISAPNAITRVVTASLGGTYIFNIGPLGTNTIVSDDGSAAVTFTRESKVIFWSPSPRDDHPPQWLSGFLNDYSGCKLASDGQLVLGDAKLKGNPEFRKELNKEIPKSWESLRERFVAEER